MPSVNKVIIIGNLGRDPEVRSFPDGGAICNITVATTRAWKDKDGNKQEETEWHRVVFRDRLAEIAGEYLRKGRPVYVEGRLKTRKWQDKEGRDTYTTEILADQMQLLGDRESGDYGGDRQESRGTGGQPRGGRQDDRGGSRQSSSQQRDSRAPTRPSGYSDMDDDLPY